MLPASSDPAASCDRLRAAANFLGRKSERPRAECDFCPFRPDFCGIRRDAGAAGARIERGLLLAIAKRLPAKAGELPVFAA